MDGDDEITLTGGDYDNLSGGAGNDSIDLTGGSAINADGGDDDDTITLDGATITNNIFGGDEDDFITLTSGSANNAYGGADDDTIMLDGATITNQISGSLGNDTITLTSGSTDEVLGGDGDDTITLNGATINTGISADDGNDEITLTAGAYDTFVAGSGNDSIALNGGSANFVFGGADRDTIILDGATINNRISADDGNDSIILTSGSVSDVFGGSENDTVTVGAGFNLANLTGDLDGGDNVDVLNFEGAGTLATNRLLNWEVMTFSFDFTLTGDLVHPGTLSLGTTGVVGNVVDINGNLSGNGGLVLDVDVDAGTADRLAVAGAITGNHVLTLNVAPGAVGTATMGNGIELVTATDLAGAGFSLGGPVVVGVYSYGLAVVGNSVFLQSGLAGQFSGYSVIGEVIRDSFPTLRERLGDRILDADRNVWARVSYDNRRVRPDSAGPLTGGDWDERRTEIAVGTDVARLPFGDGELIASLGVHVVGGRATTLGATTAATAADGLGLNGALTWFGAGGTYVDVQGRLTRWDVSSGAGATTGETNGQSWGLSVEAGQSLTFGGATITPRMQVIYGESRFDGFTDSGGSTVADGGSDTAVVSTGVTY